MRGHQHCPSATLADRTDVSPYHGYSHQTGITRQGIHRGNYPIHVELAEHSPGATHTGIGRYTHELYTHLARLADRVSVRLTRNISPPLAQRLSVLHHLPVGVQGHQAGNIVHFVQILGCAQMLWRPVRPAVATVHDLGLLIWPERLPLKKQINRLLFALSLAGLRRMDAIITISEFTRQGVIKHLRIPAARVHTVHAGIDLDLFRPIAGARQQLARHCPVFGQPDARCLLYVGSEMPRKNLGTLLRALALVAQEHPNVHLLKVGAAGSAELRTETLRLIDALSLQDRVHFCETIPDTDLPLFYSAADGYVCPSQLEGFGLPVAEAMACGAPVVCSNTTALPEVAGDTALLVPPLDAEAFASAIMRLLDDEGMRQRLITGGLQRAARFSWQNTAEGVLEVYQHLAR